jgi:hypothetical protein
MYTVCQVCGPTQTFYEGTERSFDDLTEAVKYMAQSFKTMYGDVCIDDYSFWDPILGEQSVSLHTIEMFAPDEEDGWYLYKDWEKVH